MSMGDRIAVLSQGRPEQVGTAEEIYDRPVNRFVADFIGDINFLDATKATGQAITIEGVTLPVEQQLDSVPSGSKLTAAVRPERITLGSPDASETGSVMPGVISGWTFMGMNLRCEVTLRSGTKLLVRVAPPFDAAVVHPGANVSVSISPKYIRVVDQ